MRQRKISLLTKIRFTDEKKRFFRMFGRFFIKREGQNLKHLKGVNAPHLKNTSKEIPVEMPVPDMVTIPMGMHIGAPCKPVVAVGDEVKVGQLIGEPQGFVGAPIHSSVSGKVKGLVKIQLFNGMADAVQIEADKEQTVWEGIKPPEVTDTKSFLDAVRASGLVGLGGAGFPTMVKLSIKEGASVDYLIINGAECEPYLTSDYSTMMIDTDFVISGAAAVKKYTNAGKVIIAIEDNKPDAVALFKEKTAGMEGFEVASLPSKYPQGGEKVLIYNLTQRIVAAGKLPLDVGCIVMNMTSTAFLGKYLKTGMPLTSKCVTIEGSAAAHPCKIIAPIGTKVKDVIEAAGGYKGTPAKLIAGGPMMGMTAPNDEIPVVKNSNGFVILDEKDAALPEEGECINCGRCADACPLKLMPNRIARAFKHNDLDELANLQVTLCMECGCCSYVCPAKRDLVLRNKLSKAALAKRAKRG